MSLKYAQAKQRELREAPVKRIWREALAHQVRSREAFRTQADVLHSKEQQPQHVPCRERPLLRGDRGLYPPHPRECLDCQCAAHPRWHVHLPAANGHHTKDGEVSLSGGDRETEQRDSTHAHCSARREGGGTRIVLQKLVLDFAVAVRLVLR